MHVLSAHAVLGKSPPPKEPLGSPHPESMSADRYRYRLRSFQNGSSILYLTDRNRIGHSLIRQRNRVIEHLYFTVFLVIYHSNKHRHIIRKRFRILRKEDPVNNTKRLILVYPAAAEQQNRENNYQNTFHSHPIYPYKDKKYPQNYKHMCAK